jgi:four helix bundle protein
MWLPLERVLQVPGSRFQRFWFQGFSVRVPGSGFWFSVLGSRFSISPLRVAGSNVDRVSSIAETAPPDDLVTATFRALFAIVARIWPRTFSARSVLLARCMATARRFEDLIAWQLSEQLKEEIVRLIERSRVARDVDFCDDLRRSARSAPANISEGFGCYDPRPNARYVAIAKASLDETRNHILEGFKRSHFDVAERDDLLKLQERAYRATTRYLRYLKSCKRAPDGTPYKPRGKPAPAECENQEPENREPQN